MGRFRDWRGDEVETVTLTTGHPRVTLLTMVASSPDWFVGVFRLSLRDSGGNWLVSHSVDLFPYDAGTTLEGACAR